MNKLNHIEPTVSVGILSAESVQIAFLGEYRCKENGDVFSGDVLAQISNSQIVIGNKTSSAWHFEPTNSEATFEIKDVTIGIDFHWERKENQRFEGELHLIQSEGKIVVINHLAVERYLFSVIASEMSANASLELLKAHAVISRSWLMKPILEPEPATESQHTIETNDELTRWYERDAHALFDVCADDHCQRYQGVLRAKNPLVQQAILETKGEVLVKNGRICDARFSKSCGGVSEQFETCWADHSHDYLQPIRDAHTGERPDLTNEIEAERWIRNSPESFCNTNDQRILSQVLNNYDQETHDFYRWQVHYSQAELSELIRQKSGFDFGKIVDLIPIERGTSARLKRLKIVGTKLTKIVGKELEIRRWLSPSHLYSSAFVVDKDEDANFTLTGAGWGHGVGLCQIGAAVMGDKGYQYDQILKHYFSGAEIKRLS